MKMYPAEAAYRKSLRGGRAGVGAADGRPEDEGTVQGCVAARAGERGSEAVPAPSPAAQDWGPLRWPGWASLMLGAAYQVSAEPLSLAVSAYYPTHPSRPSCVLCLPPALPALTS